jgi:type IV pilus assembly protein PilA
MAKQKGFSLIELLIVVAIILIIAAIAIPNLLKGRLAANNSAGAATIRTLNTAEATYLTTYPTAGFADIPTLGPSASSCPSSGPTSTNACLLDNTVGCTAQWCQKDAFWYNITLTTGDYTVTAIPVTGQADRTYCSNGDQSLHFQFPSSVTATPGTAPATAIAHDACAGFAVQ